MSVWRKSVPPVLLLSALSLLAGCAALRPQEADGPVPAATTSTSTTDSSAAQPAPVASLNVRALTSVLPELLSARAVVVGEEHDRLDHHVLQLDVLRYLQSVNPRIAIGLEFFDVSVQDALDDYVAGRIDEQTMLRETGYFDRWRFDYRLYAPILRFARQKNVPLIALNVPREVSRSIARGGLESLSEAERAYVPDELDRTVPGYEERIRSSFAQHGETPLSNVEHFIEAQLVWDEAMADTAARYLEANPADQMVVLAGVGHVMYGSGIPTRLERRIGPPVLTVVPVSEAGQSSDDMADYLVRSEPLSLPDKGTLGIMLSGEGDDGLRIDQVLDDSAAGRAGLLKGDLLRAVDGQPVSDFAALAALMWDKRPGDKVVLRVERPGTGETQTLDVPVTL
ncbi:ChaN family lipoprotein [Granulosicoccaceae sp. 1_MG-2023]|nr:ChaN family lipoprotein [Granulosicoccaceae sp. 1_MG-2023]